MPTAPTTTKLTTRALGALVGGAGTYFGAHWFNAWGLSDLVIWVLSAGMAALGFSLGPKIWHTIIHLV